MTAITVGESFASPKPARRWIALLRLPLTGTSIATFVYGVLTTGI